MIPQGKIKSLNDLFVPLSKRERKQTYFVRIHTFSTDILQFLQKYYTVALQGGALIDGTIPNPNESNLTHYQDKMGQAFEFDYAFIEKGIKTWMPRIKTAQQSALAEAIYEELAEQHRQGKTPSILKNAYIKYCCWMYSKFERISGRLGEDDLPRILYIGQISRAELQMMHILNRAGCDVVLVQKAGENAYLKLDATSEISQVYEVSAAQAFPEDFSMAKLSKLVFAAQSASVSKPSVPVPKTSIPAPKTSIPAPSVPVSKPSLPVVRRDISIQPQKTLCINAWDKVTGRPLEDALMPATLRCSEDRFIGTVFARINGVEEKYTYQNELRQFYQQLLAKKRPTVLINGNIEMPTADEIQSLRRRNYQSIEEMIVDLRTNISVSFSPLLQNLMQYAFTEIMLEFSRQPNVNVSKAVNLAVHLLCWLKRYQKQLFSKWQSPEVACLIYMGACRNERESWFLRMMAHIPMDVILLHPNLDEQCLVEDESLLNINYEYSMTIEKFPDGHNGMSTVAHDAQREITGMLFQDTGMYRERQFAKADSIALRTTYDEIMQLWNEDVKYRPNYTVVNDTVSIPVIYAKVCGVTHGDTDAYWCALKRLMNEQTKVITQLPFFTGRDAQWTAFPATDFYQHGLLRRDKIQAHKQYPFGILREETQNYMLDKLQLMLDRKMIRGIGVNGTEYQVISTVLNLPKEFQRMIQQFDFTQKNPKLLIVNTKETLASAEDAILITFLHLIGFDVVIFVPTGYQSIEKWLAEDTMDEHQLGKYLYNLSVPDFRFVSTRTQFSLKKLLNFKNLMR